MSAPSAFFDVVVIGAGPAGLEAALGAARGGVRVALLDAAPAAGGQYWMQRSGALPPLRLDTMEEGRRAIAAVRDAGVSVFVGAEVWAIVPDRCILATTADGPLVVAACAIVVATGAYDRVPPFPGWTLPGVVTAGAAQRLAKLGGTAAGSRVVVAGSGPFLPVVAGALRAVGASVVAFVEARRPAPALLAHVARHPDRWREAAALLRTLAASTRSRRWGWVVTEAVGADRVGGVRIAPIRSGAIDRARTRTLEGVDALVVGWGFRPSIDVTALLRCDHAYDEAAGGWYCLADPVTGRTSVPHVFAAGEVTGVGGAAVARWSGWLAGVAAARDAGGRAHVAPAAIANATRNLARARRFVAPLNARSSPPRLIDDLAGDDTIVCRCECVTKRELLDARGDGASDVAGVKRWTRAGMGPCQGRICGWPVARIVAPDDPARAGYNVPRIPIRPVSLATVERACRDMETLEMPV